jgi:exopolysaccharide production protein ExoY
VASISIPRASAPAREGREIGRTIGGLCERLASAGLLVALTPVMIGAAAGDALLSRRTPLIAHRRVGWRGTTLWMLKLRTMWGSETAAGVRRGCVEYIEDAAGPQRKRAADPRVTSRFARFCRLHSLDEVPQLWHVVRGQMSLVGPRPVTAAELRRYYGRDAAEVLQHKPGIAGLWQVSGRNRLTYAERRRLDLELVRNRSLRLYWKILLRTIPEIVSGKDTW